MSKKLKRSIESFFIALVFLIMIAPIAMVFSEWKNISIAELEAISGWAQTVMIMSIAIPFILVIYSKLTKSLCSYFGMLVLSIGLMIATIPSALSNIEKIPIGYKNVRARGGVITVDSVDEATYNNWLGNRDIEFFIGKNKAEEFVIDSVAELNELGAEWIDDKLVVNSEKFSDEYRLTWLKRGISRSLLASYILILFELLEFIAWRYINKKLEAGDTVLGIKSESETDDNNVKTVRKQLEAMSKIATR